MKKADRQKIQGENGYEGDSILLENATTHDRCISNTFNSQETRRVGRIIDNEISTIHEISYIFSNTASNQSKF